MRTTSRCISADIVRNFAFVTTIAALFLASVAPPPVAAAAAAAAAPAVFAVDPTVTVRPEAARVVSEQDKRPSADIVAARNEFESVQVVIEAGDVPLDDVSVALANPGSGLVGNGGGSIPGGNVTIYREADYTVPADYVSDGDGGVGRWPDPLIPEVDPYYGQNRNAFPVDVSANERVAAWIDVLVPQDQAPGQYDGSLVVTTSAGQLDAVSLRVKVVDLTMPSTTTMDTAFLLANNNSVCEAHTNMGNCGNEEKRWAMHSLYGRAALENRVTISNVAPFAQDEGPPTTQAKLSYFNRYFLPLISGTDPVDPPASVATAPWSPIRLPGARFTTQSIYGYAGWHCPAACVDAWETFAGTHGYKDRLWLYACDEPGATAVLWDNCDGRGLGLATDFRKLVTAHPQNAKNHGKLAKIDTIVTSVREITGKTYCCGERFEGNQRDLPIYDEFLAADAGTPSDQVWIYTACDAVGCNPVANSQDQDWNHTLWDDWPSYVIDQKATQARAMGWLVYAYDATGELYYEVASNLRAAWTNSYHFGGHGEGTLFYPGIAKAGTGGALGAPVIGGTDDIPIESLRLKKIRDAREDYELLRMLDAAGKTGQAQTIVKDLFGASSDTLDQMRAKAAWTTPTADEMTGARCAALAELIGGPACTWTTPSGADLRITGTTLKAPAGSDLTLRLDIRNNGPEVALGVQIVDTLPAEVRFQSASTQDCSRVDRTVTCQMGALESGSSAAVDLVVRPASAGPFTNAAMVQSGAPDAYPGNNTSSLTLGPSSICDVRGGSTTDRLVGTDAAEVICGLGGNDTLIGNGGDDLIFGGPGTDVAAYPSSPAAMIVNLNFQGLDAEGAWPRRNGAAGDGNDHFFSIERAIASPYNDLMVGFMRASNRLVGGGGHDTIHGYDAKDTLIGGSGDDKLYGRASFDTLNGGTGRDLCQDANAAKTACER